MNTIVSMNFREGFDQRIANDRLLIFETIKWSLIEFSIKNSRHHEKQLF